MTIMKTVVTCVLLLAVFCGIEAATNTYHLSYRSGGVNYAQYNLYNDKIYVHTTTSVVFSTKGKNDCHLLLKKSANDYNNNVIEIVIGGWSNTQSVIRTSQQGSHRDEHKESGILSTSSYRQFWISWANNCIKVGKGSTVGSSEFMGWCGLSHAINYMSIGYGYGSDGYFQFTIAQDGNWGSWGSYGGCSKSCGTGTQSRSRSCNNPAPAAGGATCAGSSSSSQNCNTNSCPINGGWSGWASWGSCTKTCGSGSRSRTRACNNPSPQHGGATCSGSGSDSSTCNTNACPINGGWSTWTTWEKCTCDSQSRSRSCTNPAPQNGGSSCSGSSSDTQSCSSTYCPVSCRDVYTEDITQTSGLFTIYNNNKEPFPVYCVFSDGYGYTYVSPTVSVDIDVSNLISINSEIYIRQLRTDNTQHESRITQLARYKTRPMSLQFNKHVGYQTFINTGMTPYLYLGMLPNVGIQHLGDTQGYAVNGQDQSFTNCDGNPNGYFVFLFNQNNVPISTYNADSTLVRQWANLATPTNTAEYLPVEFFKFVEVHFGGCGGYVQSNQIADNVGAAIGIRYDVACSATVPDATRATKSLSGNIHGETVTYTCNSPYTVVAGDAVHTCGKNGIWSGTLPTCGLNGGWSAWATWTSCTKTCNSGSQERSRTCDNPAPLYGGATCSGSGSDAQSCNTQNCPVDGGWSAWSSWNTCTKTCATGSQARSRTCTNPAPLHGGASCTGSANEDQTCNTQNCPINGGWSAWATWTSCTKTCNSGSQERSRTCDNPAPLYGGATCSGSGSDTQSCNTQNCPVDGGWSAWSSWNTCTKTCATGSQARSRTCTNPAPLHGGASCTGSANEDQTCNTQNCPIDGGWSSWTSWTICSKTCGTGSLDRSRTCDNPAPLYGGATCAGSTNESQTCNTHHCPIDGVWGSWSRYTACSVSCLGGYRNRTRDCDNPAPSHGGANCTGDDWELNVCNTNLCNVTPPVDGNWGAWASWQGCSASCGTGVTRRYRNCDNPSPDHNGLPCLGDNYEQNSCSGGGSCPVRVDGGWSTWSTSSQCSATCGDGRSLRVRYCTNPSPSNGGSTCFGDATVMSTCRIANCTSTSGTGSTGASYAGTYLNLCPTGMFSCKAGGITCIDENFVCDCGSDCDDGSDEQENWAGCQTDVLAMCEGGAAGLGGMSLVATLIIALLSVLIGQ